MHRGGSNPRSGRAGLVPGPHFFRQIDHPSLYMLSIRPLGGRKDVRIQISARLLEHSPACGIRTAHLTVAYNITRNIPTLGRLALFAGILHITEKCESLKYFTPVSGGSHIFRGCFCRAGFWNIRHIAPGIFDFCQRFMAPSPVPRVSCCRLYFSRTPSARFGHEFYLETRKIGYILACP